jgi:hypothetical protein
MKRTLLATTICLVLGGCIISKTIVGPDSKPIASPKIVIGQIDCLDGSVAAILRDNINQELLKSGIETKADQNNATIILVFVQLKKPAVK